MWNILILTCQPNIFTVKKSTTFSVITLPTGKISIGNIKEILCYTA